jgi:hypothetical protein
MACSYADIKSSTQRVVQYLERMKSAVDDRGGS